MYTWKKNLPEFIINTLHLLLGIILLLIALLVLSGCTSEEQAAGGFAMPPMPVEVAQVKSESIAEKFEAVGTMQAVEEITVVSEIDASVINLPFREGSYVQKGSLIAQLDDAQLAAEVVRTEAVYNQNKSAYERVKKIVEEKAATLQNLDDAYANLKIAEANYIIAKSRLSKARIVAPFSGMIGARKVSVGTFLRAGEEITKLANVNNVRVSFSVPERFVAQLKQGSEVTISTPVYPDYKIKGKIIAADPVLDVSTRSINMVAQVPNTDQKLIPGMSANVDAAMNEQVNAASIPNEAVFANGQQSFVYLVKQDSTVSLTPITIGTQLANVVEVKEGLKEGMMVVKAGHQKLFDGAKVMPVQSKEMLSAR